MLTWRAPAWSAPFFSKSGAAPGYHYTQLITGTLVTYLIGHTRPGFYLLLGGALIFASGPYIAVSAREVVPLTVP